MKPPDSATLMRCFLLGVMPMAGASVKTMKEIGQALSLDSSFFDEGLGGDDLNLQVIESSLMSMVREGTSPSLKPGIEAIYSLTNDMKAAVVNQTHHQQMNLTDAWYEWKNCTPAPGARQSENEYFDAVRESCQTRDSNGLLDWDGNVFNGTVDEWYNTHCRQNCTQVCEDENAIALQSCPQAPISCQKQWAPFDGNTDVRAHMVYLQSVFGQKMALASNCTNGSSSCRTQCETRCPSGQYNFTHQNCSNAMCRFENNGCQLRVGNCLRYQDCYTQGEQDYNRTASWVSSQELCNKQEYRAILRINCLLDAFLASIDNNVSLSVGIGTCINTTFNINDPTYFANVSISYYNTSEHPRQNCSDESFPSINPAPFGPPPGSEAWRNVYYSVYIAAGATLPTCSDPSLQALIPQCENDSSAQYFR
eukprot:TRINITY_DN3967_c0_g1_i1.p1 TRINITY_DN3967_c0_g1~~TRINITY_DN3967_c0_g1_i1.p1  ORF type:complete len:422 (-),score=46.24 TRINITY_DN3967_c0_g1_i1:61-1326(-)